MKEGARKWDREYFVKINREIVRFDFPLACRLLKYHILSKLSLANRTEPNGAQPHINTNSKFPNSDSNAEWRSTSETVDTLQKGPTDNTHYTHSDRSNNNIGT